jgi:hypothetical protein
MNYDVFTFLAVFMRRKPTIKSLRFSYEITSYSENPLTVTLFGKIVLAKNLKPYVHV